MRVSCFAAAVMASAVAPGHAAAQITTSASVQAASQSSDQPAAPTVRIFVTAQGVELVAPFVTDLDCDGLQAVLRAIERSGYRAGLAPRDPADAALRQYEDRLSRRRYALCLHPGSLEADVRTVFAEGYDEQDAGR